MQQNDSLAAGAGHLRWMRRKDMLAQDIYLLGVHGPMRRWLALVFCHKLGREMEYVALTQDTTESDLKQRREIVAGGAAQPAARALPFCCIPPSPFGRSRGVPIRVERERQRNDRTLAPAAL